MILEKYGDEEITLDKARVYEQSIHFKPRGFWFSVKGDDDWPTLCRSEDFWIERLEVCHEVVLADGWDILHISTPQGLLDLTERFGEKLHPNIDRLYINWAKVAEEYDGIIIDPYQWGLRLDDRVFWYYSWDCSSGVIWNLEAIKSLTVKP